MRLLSKEKNVFIKNFRIVNQDITYNLQRNQKETDNQVSSGFALDHVYAENT